MYTFITDDDDLAGATPDDLAGETEEEEPGLEEPAGATPEYDLTGAGAGAEYELLAGATPAGLPPPIP